MDPLLKAFDNGITCTLLPLDDKDIAGVFSPVVDDQVRPEPPLVTFTPIRSRRQPLLGVTVPVVVKVDGEFVLPQILPEPLLQIDPETMY